ncbi:MAG: DUF2125 domain-containing protein [Pseudomonadota bacterium]
MKRAYLAIGVVATIIVAWSVAWWLGRETMRTVLTQETTALAAAGIDLDYEIAWTDGYPFAHRLLLRDVTLAQDATGSLTLPSVMISRGFPGGGDVTISLPQSALLSVAGAAGSEGSAEGAAEYSLALDGGEITLSELTPEEGIVAGALAGVTVTLPPDGDGAAEGELALSGLTLRLIRPTGTAFGMADRDWRLILDAESAAIRAAAGPGTAAVGQAVSRWSAAIERVGVTARWQGTDPMLGGLTASLRSGAIAVQVAGAPPLGDAALSMGTFAGTYSVSNGLGTVRATLDETTLTHRPATGQAAPRSLAIDRVDIAQSDPVSPITSQANLEVRLSAGEIVPDDAAWNWLDAAGRLPRETGQIHFTMNARAVPSNLPDPYLPLGGRIASLAFDIDMRGLGAAAAGTVQLQIAADGSTRGGGRIVLDGSMGLIRDLIAAEVMDIPTAQFVLDLAARYARPGALPEDLVVDIRSENGQLVIGDEEVTLFQPLLPAPNPPDE